MSKLIAFAGLPGTGKTTLAKALAERLGAVYLNKDEVRAALFVHAEVEYSSRQNDFCMNIVYQLAAYHAERQPERHIIIDGRTYSRTEQVTALRECAVRCRRELVIIECTCSQATAEARIAGDVGKHVAADRSVELYRRVKAGWQEIAAAKLVMETEATDVEVLVERLVSSVLNPVT